MTYATARAAQSQLEAVYSECSKKMNAYPRGRMGLTLDEVKNTDEWKADRSASEKAFAAYRNFNRVFVKTYKKEMREERRKRNAS